MIFHFIEIKEVLFSLLKISAIYAIWLKFVQSKDLYVIIKICLCQNTGPM